MEAQQQHDQNSEASDEEMEDQSDEQAGRSYECVYCRRGFTTAQALGGHMNIHRKDRARTHATTKTSTTGPFPLPPPLPKQVPKLHPPLFLNCPPPPPPSATRVNYPTYFPQSTSMAAAAYKSRSQFEEDWCSLRMSLEVGGASHTGDGGGGDQGESKKDDELDLELRLGYDP